MKIAQEVDPAGIRTIGVLTKVDLMDAGTNALEIITNKSSLHLKLGFVAVVNRSHQDIYNDKEVTEALIHEREYFWSHPAYRQVADKCGSNYLAKVLNNVLMLHIKELLPELRVKLNHLIATKQSELCGFGEGLVTASTSQKGTAVLRSITKFCIDFFDCIDGTIKNGINSEM